MTESPVVSAPVMLGIVGHVDHGKTALVGALTGMQTDRLAEERARGLSIVLGFAHAELAGRRVDFIDTPGHQAFVRAMIAGAGSIDGAIVVVAATEGVMPQTREHVSIASLLGVPGGLVVLTKADAVDATQLAARRAEVADFIQGTFLDAAPVLVVSAQTGQGLDTLVAAIASYPHRRLRDPGGPVYLPIDRAFSMAGYGMVVTGTLHSGTVESAAHLQLLPGGRPVSVRGVQVHGSAVSHASAGSRVAVNLRGIDQADVQRGDVLAAPGTFTASRRLDVRLHVLTDAPEVRNGHAFRLLIGTSEAQAKVRILGPENLRPGASGFVQLRCDRPVMARFGEHFILRSHSPALTCAGGSVLDPLAARARRGDPVRPAQLAAVEAGGQAVRLGQALGRARLAGSSVAELGLRLGADAATVRQLLATVPHVAVGQWYLERAAAERLLVMVMEALESLHGAASHRRGFAAEEIMQRLPMLPRREALDWAVAELGRAGRLEADAASIRLTGFDPLANLDVAQRELAARLEARFARDTIEALDLNALGAQAVAVRDMLRLLLEGGRLVRLQTTDRKVRLALHADAIALATEKIRAAFPAPVTFAVKDVRDVLGSTRRHVVPLLEHLDAVGVTLRKGDQRALL